MSVRLDKGVGAMAIWNVTLCILSVKCYFSMGFLDSPRRCELGCSGRISSRWGH